jgi:hypothetical protein
MLLSEQHLLPQGLMPYQERPHHSQLHCKLGKVVQGTAHRSSQMQWEPQVNNQGKQEHHPIQNSGCAQAEEVMLFCSYPPICNQTKSYACFLAEQQEH